MEISITNLERDENDGVVRVHWHARQDDHNTGNSAETTGTQEFTPEPNKNGWVDFDVLTEEIVKEWLTLDGVGDALQAKVDKLNTPETTSGLPW